MFSTVAQGTSFDQLAQTVSDMNLPPGTEVRAEMSLKGPFEWIFDIAGAELAVSSFIPPGLELVDVWGADGKGFILMKVSGGGISANAARMSGPAISAFPIALAATLAFIRSRWLSIIIAGFVLATIVSFIIIAVRVSTETPTAVLLVVALVAGALAISYLSNKQGGRSWS